MKRVYQEVVDPETGDCLRACVASILELSLSDVPNFMLEGRKWFAAYYDFMLSKGYVVVCRNRVEAVENAQEYYVTAVKSKVFPGRFHSVVVDSGFNVVHDPNPQSSPPYELTSIDEWIKK